jgi:hypothetical protein
MIIIRQPPVSQIVEAMKKHWAERKKKQAA